MNKTVDPRFLEALAILDGYETDVRDELLIKMVFEAFYWMALDGRKISRIACTAVGFSYDIDLRTALRTLVRRNVLRSSLRKGIRVYELNFKDQRNEQ
ncbi:hypothetical protein [Phyllobacterium lublinensis]|uniref:hypothetical protein n=1 Tax=Phyllobacterium lublinensis TaxID=2875708 RepID=UPI001CCF6430|nr:hypothetical protein [Phyllobacterium sp. 2063]MBZ9655788.1 hypothetical protein [Phyllobacterium sp. 2063]